MRAAPYAQLLQWVFMAAPNHPAMVLLCERLSQQATATFDHLQHQRIPRGQTMATLERTGPGLFTDVVNEWNDNGYHDHWKPIVLLPQSAFGRPAKMFEVTNPFQYTNIYTLHHFAGSWKPNRGSRREAPPCPPTASSSTLRFEQGDAAGHHAEIQRWLKQHHWAQRSKIPHPDDATTPFKTISHPEDATTPFR